MSLTTLVRQPGLKTLSSILSEYQRWRRYNQPGKNSVADRLPWITFSAIDFITRIVRPDLLVFEYGSGGSTLFWAERVKHIFSVEHDMEWYRRMERQLSDNNIGNATYILAEPADDSDFLKKDAANPDDCISSDPLYHGKNFRKYVETIDQFPSDHLDVIIVDGRARPSCIKHAIPKLKKNGYLIVDNTDRAYYLQSFDFSGWKIHHFAGPAPYIPGFSKTTILQKK